MESAFLSDMAEKASNLATAGFNLNSVLAYVKGVSTSAELIIHFQHQHYRFLKTVLPTLINLTSLSLDLSATGSFPIIDEPQAFSCLGRSLTSFELIGGLPSLPWLSEVVQSLILLQHISVSYTRTYLGWHELPVNEGEETLLGQALLRLADLRSLHLISTQYFNNSWATLPAFPRLEGLRLDHCHQVDPASLETFLRRQSRTLVALDLGSDTNLPPFHGQIIP